MPFKPGQTGNIAGRPVGAKSKHPTELRRTLFECLKQEGFDPVATLVKVHRAAWEEFQKAPKHSTADEPSNAPAYLKIAETSAAHMWKYVFPQPKSIELTGPQGADLFQSFTQLVKDVANSAK